LKMSGFIVLIILIRATWPRFRFDQLLSFGWKVVMPLALINLLVTGGVVLWKQG
jgi:NADH-quinone oxidoreductase subunit H